jgi:hypothetical protein
LAFSHIARPMWGRWLHCYPPSRGGVTIATNYNCLLILLAVNSLLVLLVALARLFNRPIIKRLGGVACAWPLPGLATVHFPRSARPPDGWPRERGWGGSSHRPRPQHLQKPPALLMLQVY